MKSKIISYMGVLFLCMVGISSAICALEPCQVFLIQVPDKSSGELNEKERAQVLDLIGHFADREVAAVYASDASYAQETAGLIAQSCDLPVTVSSALNVLSRDTLFQRVEGIRTFTWELVDQNRGKIALLITHESVVLFIGRYLDGGFKPIPNYSYVEIHGDGESPYLNR